MLFVLSPFLFTLKGKEESGTKNAFLLRDSKFNIFFSTDFHGLISTKKTCKYSKYLNIGHPQSFTQNNAFSFGLMFMLNICAHGIKITSLLRGLD